MEKPSKVDVFLVSFQIEFLQLFSANATILKKDAQNSPELKISYHKCGSRYLCLHYSMLCGQDVMIIELGQK